MSFSRLALAVVVATTLLVGCGEGGEETSPETAKAPPPERLKVFQTVELTLDGEPGPEIAGLLTANSLGYFSEAGLAVETYTPTNPGRPVQYVVDGTTDLAITNLPQVVLAREKGAPIVAIGSLVPEPTISMIWLEESKISGIADLKGKTIAIPGASFQRSFLEAVLARAGLTSSDVKIEQAGYELVPDLVSGRVDAIFGGSWNVEGADLELEGVEPVITRAADLGIPPYDELVVIARRDRVRANPKLHRVFMAAVRRGTPAAIEDPQTAVEAISMATETEFRREPAEAGLDATLPLLSTTGEINPTQARDLIAWMHGEGMIRRKPPVSALLAQP